MKKQYSKLLAVIMAAAMIIPCVIAGTAVSAASVTFSADRELTNDDKAWYGDGSAAEFTITTAAELAYFMELGQGSTPVSFAGKTIKLGADIVWNDGVATKDGFTAGASGKIYQWKPYAIGSKALTGQDGNKAKWFQGTVNGQGHSISGLVMSGDDYQAFICAGWGITIQNLTLKNTFVETTKASANNVAAGLISRITGKITLTNVHATDLYIKAAGYISGGFIGLQTGYNEVGINFTDCSVNGNIAGDQYCGGFIGANSKAPVSFTNCTSFIDIQGSDKSGGFIGVCCGNATLTNCAAVGTVSGTRSAAIAYLYNEAIRYGSDAKYTSALTTATVTLKDTYYRYQVIKSVGSVPFNMFNGAGIIHTVISQYGSAEAKTVVCQKDAANNANLSAIVTSLNAGDNNTAMISIKGAQTTAINDGKYSLRLIAAIDMTGVEESDVVSFGYTVKNMYNTAANTTISTDTVYDSITSDYGLTTVSASDAIFDCDYLSTLVIEGISAGAMKSIMVRPTVTVKGAEENVTYYGAWTFLSVYDGVVCNTSSASVNSVFPSVA